MPHASFLVAAAAAALAPLGHAAAAVSRNECSRIVSTVKVDVAIIGGGASGSYAAVELGDVRGKDIVVIEPKGKLGGHVDTAAVPNPAAPGGVSPVDYGVQAYLDLPAARALFSRFSIPLVPAVAPELQQIPIDFKTGKPPAIAPVDPQALGDAISRYSVLAAQYQSFVFPFYNPPNPLVGDQKDLALPFGEFVKKHDLALVYGLVTQFLYAKNLPELPTIYVLANAGVLQLLASVVPSETPFLVPASHNNSQLYAAIQDRLNSKILLNSHVVSVDRSKAGAPELIVSTPAGCKKIKAKKILVTAPPILDNLRVFDLDNQEQKVFKKWDWANLYTGVVAGTGLPDASAITNFVVDNLGRLFPPSSPYVRGFTGFVPGLQHLAVVGGKNFGPADAKDLVSKSLKKMKQAGTFNTNENPVYVGFADHSPSTFTVSSKHISCGFFSRLNALQGHKDTFYTGAAWTADYSSIVWTHADIITKIIIDQIEA